MIETYRNGYIKALIDVRNYFETHSDCLKYWKMYNQKKIPLLLQAFIDNADCMMSLGEDINLLVATDKKTKETKIICSDRKEEQIESEVLKVDKL